jgi:hypothetical protein
MNVGDLKKALADVPDSVEVSISVECYVPHNRSSLPTVLCQIGQENKPALRTDYLSDQNAGGHGDIFKISC